MDGITKPNGSDRMLRTLLTLMMVFFVMILVSGSLGMWLAGYMEPGSRAAYLAQSVVQSVVGFIGTAYVTARLTARSPFGFLAMTQPVDWHPFVGVVIVYLLCMPFLNQLIFYNASMQLPDALAPLERYMEQMEEINGKVTEIILSSDSVGGLISGILIVGVLTGLAEEMLFRGTLQRALSQNRMMGQWAVWIAAIIFSAVHLQFYGFFPRLLLGAFFGYLLYSTGSIWPGVFAHALNNSIVVVSYWIQLRDPSMPDAEMWGVSEHGFPVWGALSMVATALFLIFCYRYFFNTRQYGKADADS